MSYFVTFISETGFPHASILLEVNGYTHWYGFGPAPGCTYTGRVSKANRKGSINHYVRYEITDAQAREIMNKVVPAWKGSSYIFAVQDCVSFASEVAEAAGLSTNSIDMTPYGFVTSLAYANPGYTHWDTLPYPFATGNPSGPDYGPAAAPGQLVPNFSPDI